MNKKGINAIENEKDPGQDGLLPNGTSNNPNALFAQDAGAFSLEYFNSDYQSISGSVPISTVASGSHPAANSSELYNGNIRYMQTRLTNINTHDAMPMLNAYKYDQLNRLNESRSYESGLASNVWNPSSYNNEYYNAFTYDAMGNILSQKRHNRAGTMLEDMTYQYHKLNNKLLRNRLYHINDAVSASVDNTDIDDQGTFDPLSTNINQNNNYKYDEEGRLVRDIAEDIAKITWRVDGKVKEIQRGADTSTRFIRFDYDAMGHRIAKHVYDNTGTILKKSTYYILDAQGNQISMYEHEVQQEMAEFNIVERNIFGSSRLGSRKDKINLLAQPQDSILGKRLGHKNYEFSNHLGNVLIVFTDVKTPIDTDSDGTVDAYRVCLQNTFDYSPFGVTLDGRTMQGDEYRYGFNGMEKDDEVKGGGNSYDFGARMYDNRVGRWLSRDAHEFKYPSMTPYNFVLNSPICAKDPNGNDVIIMIWHPTGKENNGHVAIAVANYNDVLTYTTDTEGNLHYHTERQPDGTYSYYDFWPKAQVDTKLKVLTSVAGDYNNKQIKNIELLLNSDPSISGKKGFVSEKGEGGIAPDIIYRIKTNEDSDNLVKTNAEANKNSKYSAKNFNCTTFAIDALKSLFPENITKSLGKELCESNGMSATVCTPTELCRDLNVMSQNTSNLPLVTIEANNSGGCPTEPYLQIVHPPKQD